MIFDLFLRVIATGLAELVGFDLDTSLANFFLDLVFYRQAMAVPARDVRCVFAVQGARLDDHVFEDLVNRVADMNIAISVGRAIVKDITFSAATRCPNFFVEFIILPLFQAFGFPIGEITPHRKLGIGEIKCGFIVSHGVESINRSKYCLALTVSCSI